MAMRWQPLLSGMDPMLWKNCESYAMTTPSAMQRIARQVSTAIKGAEDFLSLLGLRNVSGSLQTYSRPVTHNALQGWAKGKGLGANGKKKVVRAAVQLRR